MTDLPETLKAFADTSAGLLAKAIADVRKEAARNEEIRQFEHRAFMAETREAVAILTRQVEERLANVKDGQDGRDGIDGKDGLDGERGADGSDGRDGTDGRDGIDGKDGLNGADGSDGRDGVDGTNGADGADGKDADMDALRKHLDALVAAIPAPQDGKDGRDGVDGKDAYPGEVKGVFSAEDEYRARDIVAYDGSSWMARKDAPGELPGEGWMLLASKGKRGDQGKEGREGKQGETGAAIIAAYADTEKLELVLTRDDGVEVKADLHPLATIIKEA